MSSPRLNPARVAPDAYQAVMGLETYVKNSGLEPRLIHLVKLCASQINGCAFCVDMHVKEARRDGLTEQWINLLCVWRASPLYDTRERALLAWVESVTEIARTGIPDADYAALAGHFSAEDIVRLTVAIGAINVWNRIAVGFRFRHPIDKAA
ncbi:Carboxymuconolactone decarboxylase family protein [Rhodovastum atsumiense]|uniref:Carboxymuconolactone decarboxylase family protein n=1 Tax=Rhodovastum atsumiense TaxID=504468 RepID=A0A5M6IYI1_9PROT|nr:carboxymuconolactone decarboxylase family protein [Rhodovastum atsumiense]KAA5613404.1 carboxymuconolactone decarboxylase family protein [Rhodovastum atsumiense]CAH2603121.1 Carboxymuconolactone decarboxylase family protein [Rhodovastum atsumiense]